MADLEHAAAVLAAALISRNGPTPIDSKSVDEAAKIYSECLAALTKAQKPNENAEFKVDIRG